MEFILEIIHLNNKGWGVYNKNLYIYIYIYADVGTQ